MGVNGELRRNQIDRYVTDQMDEQERIVFEQRMREHVELAESVHLHRDVLDGIAFHFASELKQTLIQSDQKRSKSRLKTYLAVAAGIVLLIGAGMAYYFMNMPQNQNSDGPFSAYFEPYPSIIAPTTPSSSDSLYLEVMQEYEAGHYQNAIAGFSKMIEDKPANDQLVFYRGVSYLGTGQANMAAKDFQTVIDAKEDPKFYKPAYWYLGLSQLKMDSIDQARETFQKVANENGNMSDQAKEILQDIK